MPDRKLLITAGVIGAMWVIGAFAGAHAAASHPATADAPPATRSAASNAR